MVPLSAVSSIYSIPSIKYNATSLPPHSQDSSHQWSYPADDVSSLEQGQSLQLLLFAPHVGH